MYTHIMLLDIVYFGADYCIMPAGKLYIYSPINVDRLSFSAEEHFQSLYTQTKPMQKRETGRAKFVLKTAKSFE